MDIKEFDRKLTMPKTGKLLGLSSYQEEIIEHLLNDTQTINYKTRMGNSTAVIYYLFLMLLKNENFNVCYIGASEELVNKIKHDFEMYLRYNLKFIEDHNYLDEGNRITIECTKSSVTFLTKDRILSGLEFGELIRDFPSGCSKTICENYVFSSSDEKLIERKGNTKVQYLLEN